MSVTPLHKVVCSTSLADTHPLKITLHLIYRLKCHQALARIEGKAADGVEAPDVADAVVVADWWVLFKAIVMLHCHYSTRAPPHLPLMIGDFPLLTQSRSVHIL